MSQCKVKDVTYSPIEPVRFEVQSSLVIASDNRNLFQCFTLLVSSNPSVKKRKKLQGDTRRKIEVKILRETKGGEIDRFEKREMEREKETGIQREKEIKRGRESGKYKNMKNGGERTG